MAEYILLVFAVLAASTILLRLLGANLYDLRFAKYQRLIELRKTSRQYRERPLVSVLVALEEDETTIQACLESILKVTYRKIEITIINNASRDSSLDYVKSFKKQYPKKIIKLYNKRSRSTLLEAFATGYKKYATGELVLCLNARDRLDNKSIMTAVGHFNHNKRLGAVEMNNRLKTEFSISGLFDEFSQLLRYQAKKLNNNIDGNSFPYVLHILCRSAIFIERCQPSSKLYSKKSLALIKTTAQSFPDNHYASESAIYSLASRSIVQLIVKTYRSYLTTTSNFISLPANHETQNNKKSILISGIRIYHHLSSAGTALLAPLISGYFLYLAISLRQPDFFMISCVALTIFLGFVVISDNGFKKSEKIHYILLIPVIFSWLFMASVIYAVAIIIRMLSVIRLTSLAHLKISKISLSTT